MSYRGSREATDRRCMRRALELAERGHGRVAPNPKVGAVVVRNGRVVGEGWHAEYGAAHAEAAALAEAEEAAAGSTVYVTLEPCRHEGKTPPCTRALLAAGVERVVIGCRDPHPSAGGGAEELEAAGIEVIWGVEGLSAARQNAEFLWSQEHDRPFVTLKLALSLDGRIAAAEGERTAISGEVALEHVHRLRAGHDAVLVGRRTAEVDDPRLTARGRIVPRTPPRRVVLDSRLRTPIGAELVQTAEEVPTWILCGPDAGAEPAAALRDRGVRVLTVPRDPAGDGLDPTGVLAALAEDGIRSVLVEGGGRVAASFLRKECVERCDFLHAPAVLGPAGVEAFPGLEELPGAWTPVERRPLGRDALLRLEARSLTELLEAAAAGGVRGATRRGAR